MLDVKKIEGTETRKTRTLRYIVFYKKEVKLFLTKKYNIEFIDDDDESDDEEVNGLDV